MSTLLPILQPPAEEAKHKDPVCGMMVLPLKTAGVVQYEGETYYFCCKGCVAKFEADPMKYLAPAPATPPTDAEMAVEYICPMDPEVSQMGPGSCPKCGMALEPAVVSLEETTNPEMEDMTKRLWVAIALTLPLLAAMFVEMMPSWRMPPVTLAWAEFACATPVVLWCGWPFLVRGWQSVVNRSGNMFTLIALGTGASYLYSVAATLAPHRFPASGAGMAPYLYYEPAAVIVTLVLLGQVLELRARSQTGSALRALLQLAPPTARRIESNGHETEVALNKVQPGNLLRVRPGDKVPVDGVVTNGHSFVDESMVSGESMPVEKGAGASVIGGTLNGTGAFVMRAERVGSHTMLAQIVQMVGEAQRTRAPIQRLADRVAVYFVPAVLLVAGLTFVGWFVFGPAPQLAHALVNAVAVLIVACPCALGLATPMAVMVATGRGAHAGLLIRNAAALEKLSSIDTLFLDKTGTLTAGKPEITTIVPYEGFTSEQMLLSSASLQRASEHPLAGAFLRAAERNSVGLLPVTNFRATPGLGVSGTVAEQEVAIGNSAFLQSRGISTAHFPSADAMELPEQGSAVFVALDGRAAGVVSVADVLKPTALDSVQELRKAGLRIVMLTGDREGAAKTIASHLGIEYIADLLPSAKAEAVRRFQAEGRAVAMAGDGVNDAPALAAADVGIAMATGTDIAMESAGITLIGGDLRGVLRARRLSEATVRNIRQNLFFAFVYNALGVPVAAGVLYPFFGLLLSPMIAAAAMSLSSVCVITNALRLRSTKL